jgi:hypothetical protein
MQEEMLGKDRTRDWDDASTSQETPRPLHTHQQAGEKHGLNIQWKLQEEPDLLTA